MSKTFHHRGQRNTRVVHHSTPRWWRNLFGHKANRARTRRLILQLQTKGLDGVVFDDDQPFHGLYYW